MIKLIACLALLSTISFTYADGDHSDIKCGAPAFSHSLQEGHEPIARCWASCPSYKPKFGELHTGETKFCPFANGAAGIRVDNDRTCECEWGERYCTPEGSEDSLYCNVTYNGTLCDTGGNSGKNRVGYKIYEVGNGTVSGTLFYCGSAPRARVQRNTGPVGQQATPAAIVSVQKKLTNAGTDRASCTSPKEASTNAVTIHLEGEGFNFYIWPFDGWWFASVDPNGRGDRGPNHYGRNYTAVTDADDLLAIGTNGEDMFLAGGLLDKMVCIVPNYGHSGPWTLTIGS